jgi:aryl-alcohol dehydrogenase-like predicted oxidoreductase
MPAPGGALSGKYLTDSPDPKARFNLFKGYMERYNKSLARVATEEYVKIAQKYDLTPTQLALAWCRWVVWLRAAVVWGWGAGCVICRWAKGESGPSAIV